MRKLEKVLLVEDNSATNIINSKLLMKMHVARKVITTTNGREAINYLQKLKDEQQKYPELILLGMHMPIMNGLDFLIEFNRLFGDEIIKPTIVLLSRTNSDKDIEDVTKLGVKTHLKKMLNEAKILNMLKKLESREDLNEVFELS